MTSLLLDLNEDQRLIFDSLSRAARGGNEFETRRLRLRAAPPDRMALWDSLAGLGALGLCLNEEQGGFGGTPRDMALLPAALGPALVAEPFFAVGILSARLLAAAGQDDLLAELVAGSLVAIPALADSSDIFAKPRLRLENAGLTGPKPAVAYGDVATHFIVSAVENGETVLALATADQVGVAPFGRIDYSGAADLLFDATPVRILLRGAAADHAIAEALDWQIAAGVVETAAICAAVNPATFGYLRERKQFGQPLARFQALQFKAADMHIAETEAAAAADMAIAALAADPAQRRRQVLLASLAADRCGKRCGHEAVQLHGGMGVSDELIISHYARRLSALRVQNGSPELRSACLETLLRGSNA